MSLPVSSSQSVAGPSHHRQLLPTIVADEPSDGALEEFEDDLAPLWDFKMYENALDTTFDRLLRPLVRTSLRVKVEFKGDISIDQHSRGKAVDGVPTPTWHDSPMQRKLREVYRTTHGERASKTAGNYKPDIIVRLQVDDGEGEYRHLQSLVGERKVFQPTKDQPVNVTQPRPSSSKSESVATVSVRSQSERNDAVLSRIDDKKYYQDITRQGFARTLVYMLSAKETSGTHLGMVNIHSRFSRLFYHHHYGMDDEGPGMNDEGPDTIIMECQAETLKRLSKGKVTLKEPGIYGSPRIEPHSFIREVLRYRDLAHDIFAPCPVGQQSYPGINPDAVTTYVRAHTSAARSLLALNISSKPLPLLPLDPNLHDKLKEIEGRAVEFVDVSDADERHALASFDGKSIKRVPETSLGKRRRDEEPVDENQTPVLRRSTRSRPWAVDDEDEVDVELGRVAGKELGDEDRSFLARWLFEQGDCGRLSSPSPSLIDIFEVPLSVSSGMTEASSWSLGDLACPRPISPVSPISRQVDNGVNSSPVISTLPDVEDRILVGTNCGTNSVGSDAASMRLTEGALRALQMGRDVARSCEVESMSEDGPEVPLEVLLQVLAGSGVRLCLVMPQDMDILFGIT
ncbi:hypothetical protein I317_05144 [Kwoniella heveanensis CBS 569]|nr:hypothetical protein I317_05144 [Kwoniella heveanensis CBS 569]